MAEQYQGTMNNINGHGTNSTQILGFATLFISGVILLLLAGLAVAGIVVGSLLLTPVLILLSPILISVGTVLFVTVAGLLSAAIFVLGVVFGVSWAYNYANGRRPPGSDQIDYARATLIDTANHVKDYACEYGGYLQGKVRDAAPGA